MPDRRPDATEAMTQLLERLDQCVKLGVRQRLELRDARALLGEQPRDRRLHVLGPDGIEARQRRIAAAADCRTQSCGRQGCDNFAV